MSRAARSAARSALALVLSGAVLLGCKKGGAAIQDGSSVTMNYTLTVDGTVVDTSLGPGKEPLTYVQGSGQMIPGLEKQLAGLRAGDKRTVVVAAKDAYGEYDPKGVVKVPRSAFPDAKGIKVGDLVQGKNGDQTVRARVKELGDKEITLDFNHPLAGKTLSFAVEVLQVSLPGKKPS